MKVKGELPEATTVAPGAGVPLRIVTKPPQLLVAVYTEPLTILEIVEYSPPEYCKEEIVTVPVTGAVAEPYDDVFVH